MKEAVHREQRLHGEHPSIGIAYQDRARATDALPQQYPVTETTTR